MPPTEEGKEFRAKTLAALSQIQETVAKILAKVTETPREETDEDDD